VIFTFDATRPPGRRPLRAFSLEEKFVTQTFVAVQPRASTPATCG